jgi:hypothetical protein
VAFQLAIKAVSKSKQMTSRAEGRDTAPAGCLSSRSSAIQSDLLGWRGRQSINHSPVCLQKDVCGCDSNQSPRGRPLGTCVQPGLPGCCDSDIPRLRTGGTQVAAGPLRVFQTLLGTSWAKPPGDLQLCSPGLVCVSAHSAKPAWPGLLCTWEVSNKYLSLSALPSCHCASGLSECWP